MVRRARDRFPGREVVRRARVLARVARQTGVAGTVNARGVRMLLSGLLAGGTNPALVYRVHAASSPHKPAVVWRSSSLSYAALDARIDRVATGLVARGLGAGARILVLLHNRPEVVEISAGAARAGASVVLLSYRTTPAELAYVARDAGASAVVVESSLAELALSVRASEGRELLPRVFVVDGPSPAALEAEPYEALLEQRRPDDRRSITAGEPSVVVYTSGTTGKPKGAVRTFPRAAATAALGLIAETPMHTSDVHLVACPLYHSTAFGFLAFEQMLGATAVLLESFDPEGFLAAIDRHRVTTTAVVPMMLQRVMDMPEEVRRRYDTRSLRAVCSGGAPLSGPLALDFMNAFGDVLYNFYGATETGVVTLASPEDLRASPGTIGRALGGSEIRLLDAEGRETSDLEVGELFVRNAFLFQGYHGDPEATRGSMRDGFFSVGDLARRDRAGRYVLEGRKRDLIITGGVNVYPAEVEAVLEAHPAVYEAAVVGVPSREWGERVRAVVVLRPGAAAGAEELTRFARERLSGPKVPRELLFAPALPRNPTGKVLKNELRALAPPDVMR